MLDLSDRQPLDWLARLVADVRTAVPDCELLVVGALARDLLLHHVHGCKIERATTDVDFALAVSSWEQFSRTRDALIARGYSGTTHGQNSKSTVCASIRCSQRSTKSLRRSWTSKAN